MFGRARTEWLERKALESQANREALCTPSRSIHAATYAGGTSGAAPKSEAYRDDSLLEMARGRICLLAVPGICNQDTLTTVACHSNYSIHGKAKNRRADDQYTVWGCSTCHHWLDQSKGPTYEQKMARFMLAHANQVLAWRLIAMDESEPQRYRDAARRALERLNATPIPEGEME